MAKRLIGEFPNHTDALVVMGNVHSNHGHSAEAAKWWRSCLELDPDRVDVLNGLGWFAQRKGQHEKAAALWRRALEVDPKMSVVAGRLAGALMGSGKVHEAIAILEKDIEFSPDNGASYFLLGRAYLQLKQYEKARRHYETAVRIDPDQMCAYYGLATACMRLRLRDQARQYMEKFKELKVKNLAVDHDLRSTSDDLVSARLAATGSYTAAGRIYRVQGNVEKAETLWRRAAALAPNDTACRKELALLYERSRRVAEALRVCEELRKIDPDSAQHHLNAGVLHARFRRFDAAEEALKKACQLAPQDSQARRELALLYVQADRRISEAVVLAREAVRLDASGPNYYVLGAVYAKQRDLAAAISCLEQAVALDPRNTRYPRMLEALKKGK